VNRSYRDDIYAVYSSAVQDQGERYDRLAGARWGKGYDSFLRGWLPESREAAVLDVACGGGRLLQFFADRGYTNLRGVDISQSQVDLAMQVCPVVEKRDAIEFLQANPAGFDLVIGLDIIEHFHKPEAWEFLRAVFSALRPGGRVVLQTPNGECPWPIYRYWDFTHETCFTPNSLGRLLRMAGFESVAMRETAPPVHGVVSAIRRVAWGIMRRFFMLWGLVESGWAGNGVLTRNFLASARRPLASEPTTTIEGFAQVRMAERE
jgi:2-polyprenyl-3-methyl-5-hydroxy-6-metoxy-1,4-benzoquinol methylase